MNSTSPKCDRSFGPRALSRRPSAPMIVASIALFVALGGVGWAATQLPAGSVGTKQLRSGAVTVRKIHRGAVGRKQINTGQVQARVNGRCASSAAINSISSSGGVSCAAAAPGSAPREFGTSSAGINVGTSPTTIVSKSLPSGSSYLVFGTPYASIASSVAGQHVQVNCRLSVGSVSSITRSVIVEIGPNQLTQQHAVPLILPAPSASSSRPATVDCWKVFSGTPPPTVQVVSSVNAMQTASNG
jgi:hypothetical protein